MVEIRDVTEEKKEVLNRALLEKKLADECFPGKHIQLDNSAIFIRDRLLNLMAYKEAKIIKMHVYDKSILPQAQEFAKRYEKQFGMTSDFIIEADYSKS